MFAGPGVFGLLDDDDLILRKLLGDGERRRQRSVAGGAAFEPSNSASTWVM